MNRRAPSTSNALLLVVLLAVAAASPAAAEQGPLPDHRGYPEFQQYCASCHGVTATGDGPMAPVLSVKPADLTRLGQRYGMPLPRPKLIAFIDGRTPVRGHGSKEMPVWGKKMHDDTAGSQAREGHVRGTILVILDYLEAIQKPGKS